MMKQCSVCHQQFSDRFESCPIDGATLVKVEQGIPACHSSVVFESEVEIATHPPISKRNESGPELTLTIIENSSLAGRLTDQLRQIAHESELTWPEFKLAPVRFSFRLVKGYSHSAISVLKSPNVAVAITSAMLLVVSILLSIVLIERWTQFRTQTAEQTRDVDSKTVITMIPNELVQTSEAKGTGVDGNGRIGLNKGTGEGSGPTSRQSNGGGGGGDHNRLVAQNGKPPQPSQIPAAIPILPKNEPPLLATAGFDLDPALYKDLPMDRYGDPRSKSTETSAGPGSGNGIGDGVGTGVGVGKGPGFGPGEGGNTGGKKRELGCCGSGGGDNGDNDSATVFTVNHVQLKAKILFKPEPRYTEEARKNQISGTVILKAVLSSSGTVMNIKPISALPFGLTEEAISAAQNIKFTPAIKDQHAVSQWIQIEYNFNLY
jgi:TonB family protein